MYSCATSANAAAADNDSGKAWNVGRALVAHYTKRKKYFAVGENKKCVYRKIVSWKTHLFLCNTLLNNKQQIRAA